MASDSTIARVPTIVVETPLMEPAVGEIGKLAAAPEASRRNCTRTVLPIHWEISWLLDGP